MTGVRRDCNCKHSFHAHGTRGSYDVHRCRCLPCGVAWSRAKEHYRLHGTYVTDDDALFVPRAGTDRRLQALLALGWRHSDLSARMRHYAHGATDTAQLLRRPGQWVWAATADGVRRVYDELSMTAGPSVHNRRRAAKLGYLPPLCWDDADLDDPDARPAVVPPAPVLDEVAVERHMHGTLRAAANRTPTPELLEAVRRLAGRGLTDRAVADRVGLSRDAVLKLRTRHGIPTGPRALAEAS